MTRGQGWNCGLLLCNLPSHVTVCTNFFKTIKFKFKKAREVGGATAATVAEDSRMLD